MEKAKLIETMDVERDYGFNGVMAIVDHPDHGRLLIEDGFGGTDSLEGGCVRWRHGSVYKLQPDDTFAKLTSMYWDDYTNQLYAIKEQLDDSRPWQNWKGCMLEKFAKSVGL